jgi:HlyD family secretion protein
MADIKTTRKKKSKKKLLIFSISGIVLFLIIAAVIISNNKEKLVTVQTEKITKRDITQVVSGTGTIQPETKVDISAEVSGEIIQLPFKEGAEVKKGDLLIKIKPDIYQQKIQQQKAGVNYSKSQLEVAQNNFKKAELDYQRTKQLYDGGLMSQSDLDNARIAYEVAKSQVKSSDANVKQNIALLKQNSEDLSKTTIHSPMDGILSKLNSELGEKVVGTQLMTGTTIMTVSDLTAMEADIEISENDITQVEIGDTAKVDVDAFPDRSVRGVVFEISNTAQSKNTGTQEEIVNFIVKLRILDKDIFLKPGMSCNADIKVNSKYNVVSVPIQSITARDETKNEMDQNGDDQTKRINDDIQKKKEKPKEIVFVVDEGNISKAKMVVVKTGISDDKYTEILEGLEPGAVVVKGPYKAISKDLEDGTKVKIDNEIKKKPSTDKEE